MPFIHFFCWTTGLSAEVRAIISDTIQLAYSSASEITGDIRQRGDDMFYIGWLKNPRKEY